MFCEMPSDTDGLRMEGASEESTPRESSPSQCTMWASLWTSLMTGVPEHHPL